ncbi:MAG: lipopolysaccharide kinase InaA family protein [Planctomycetes bacterium]|jgi:hypothetical protein|nr:lipopolysaccharide kinase InaA family protein [Planctomycetota bacterium]
MGSRVEVHPGLRGRVPDDFASWNGLEGAPVALSRTTRTDHVMCAGLDIHLKRARLPLGTALGAVFRNSFLGRSRAEREYRALLALPPDLAPAPVAFGERRQSGLLRESFLATLTVPGAQPLSVHHLAGRDSTERLGRFLGRLRATGLLHGSLFARNVLALPDGGFRVLDLDRARIRPGGSPWCREFARDLARLDASLPGLSCARRLRVLRSIPAEPGDDSDCRRRIAEVLAHRGEALRRLARRVPRDRR